MRSCQCDVPQLPCFLEKVYEHFRQFCLFVSSVFFEEGVVREEVGYYLYLELVQPGFLTYFAEGVPLAVSECFEDVVYVRLQSGGSLHVSSSD